MSCPKTLQLRAASAAHPAWSKWDKVLLAWSAGDGGKPPQLTLIPEVGVARHHQGSVNRHHLQPHSTQRHHRGGHCDQTPPVGALTPLGTHPPCCCHCQIFLAVPTCLISVPSQDPETRNSLCSTSMWAEMGCFINCLKVAGANHQLSLTLEIVMSCSQQGSLNRHHLQFQSPQRRALQ